MADVTPRVVTNEDYKNVVPGSKYEIEVKGEWVRATKPMEVGAPGNRAMSLMEKVGGVGDALYQGLTWGWGDEIDARLMTATQWLPGGAKPASYEENLDTARQSTEEFRQKHPGMSLAGELAGGFVTGGTAYRAAAAGLKGLAGQAPRIAGAVTSRIPGWARSTATAVGAGGAGGTVVGAGTSEPGQRLEGAKWGGGAGAALGLIMTPLGAIAAPFAQGIGGRLSPRREVVQQVKDTLDAEGTTGLEAAQELERLGPNAVVADVGPEAMTATLGRATAAIGKDTRTPARSVLTAREEGAAGRLEETVGRVSTANADELDISLRAAREDAADPAYKDAYRGSAGEGNDRISNEALSSIGLTASLRTAFGNNAFREALENFTGRKTQPKEEISRMLKAFEDGEPVSLEVLDNVQRVLRDAQTAAKAAGKTDRKKSLKEVRDRLIREIDRADVTSDAQGQGGLYQQARNLYEHHSVGIDALGDGAAFLGKSPVAIRDELAALTGDAREAYLAGAAKAMRDVIAETPKKNNPVTRFFNNDKDLSRLRALLPDPEEYNNFILDIMREQKFTQTARAGLNAGGPPMPVEPDLVRRGLGSLFALQASGLVQAGIFRSLGMYMAGKAPKKELVRLLTNQSPEENLRLLYAVQRSQDAPAHAFRDILTLVLTEQNILRTEEE
jgi:hypothetical protein